MFVLFIMSETGYNMFHIYNFISSLLSGIVSQREGMTDENLQISLTSHSSSYASSVHTFNKK